MKKFLPILPAILLTAGLTVGACAGPPAAKLEVHGSHVYHCIVFIEEMGNAKQCSLVN